MFCCRVIVFLFSIIFTACAVCANILPLYRKESDTTKEQYFFRHFEVSVLGKKTTVKYSDDSMNLGCKNFKLFWQISFILAIAGAATGGIAMILAFAHLFVRAKCSMCSAISVFLFLAFGCMGVCVALPTVTYASDMCKVENTDFALKPKLKASGFDMVEGFGLTCAACGGFLLLMFFECCT